MTDPRQPIEDDRLDEAIDSVAAGEVRLAAPADLRARVMARLSEEPRASRTALARWAAIAAAAVLAGLVIMPRWPSEQTVRPVPSSGGTTTTRPVVPAAAAATRPPSPPAGSAPRVPHAEHPAGDDAGASERLDDPLVFSRLETSALDTIEPLTNPALPITPLPPGPVVVAPLSVETGDSSRMEDMP